TFTLDGTTLRVAYTGVAPGHVVDNELCVDLWAGAHGGGLLTRAADDGGVTVAMAGAGAARIALGAGCELTAPSRAETVGQAAAPAPPRAPARVPPGTSGRAGRCRPASRSPRTRPSTSPRSTGPAGSPTSGSPPTPTTGAPCSCAPDGTAPRHRRSRCRSATS